MRCLHALLGLAAVCLFLAPAAPAGAQAPVTCRGEVATIVGTPGRDFLVGTPGRDVIAGRGGLDALYGKGGDDLICGGPNPVGHTDESTFGEGLFGGPGDDLLVGGGGFDEMFGGGGNDQLLGGRGDDDLAGEGGADTLGGGQGHGFLDGGPGTDRLDGGPTTDELVGGEGDDEVHGAGGDDVLAGDPGDDGLDGGDGHDVFDARYVRTDGQAGHAIPLTVDLAAGTSSAPEYFGQDTLADIDGTWTADGADTLLGDDGDNEFFPGAGAGEGSQELVDGGAGRDLLTFAPGAFRGAFPGGVVVDLAAGTATLPSSAVTLSGIEDVVGTDEADVIAGDGGPNRLGGGFGPRTDEIDGRGGDDDLQGGAGDDVLAGGAGTNTIRGGSGRDTCTDPGPGQAGATGCEV